MATEISEESAELEYYLDEDGEIWFWGRKQTPQDVLRHLRSYSKTIANQCAEASTLRDTICSQRDRIWRQTEELARLNAKVELLHGTTENA